MKIKYLMKGADVSQSQVSKTEAARERSEETRSFVRTVKTATRRRYTPEEKIRIDPRAFLITSECLMVRKCIVSIFQPSCLAGAGINPDANTPNSILAIHLLAHQAYLLLAPQPTS